MEILQNKNIFFFLEKLDVWRGKYEAETFSRLA